MSLKICGYLFYGPFELAQTVVKPNHTPVVFAIVCRDGEPWDPIFRLIDVGYSDAQGIQFASHPDRATWQAACGGGSLGVYLFDAAPQDGFNETVRRDLAQRIRVDLEPPQGRIPIHAI